MNYDSDIDKLDYAVEELLDRIDELESICAEAYQVVGYLADDAGMFGHPSTQKALDNLSRAELIHNDVLPFPGTERLVPGLAVEKLEELLQWGLKKYPTPKWKQISVDEHVAAAERHTWRWRMAPGFGWRENKPPHEFTLDHESGMSHLIHAFARLAFAVTLESNEQAKTVANSL
mgnify:CR=1 FL=1